MSLTSEQLQRLRTLQGALSSLSHEYEDVIPLIQSAVKDGNDTAIGMLKDQTNGLAAIKTAVGSIDIDTSDLAKQDTLLEVKAVAQTSADSASIVNLVSAEVNSSKQNIIDLLAHYGVQADMTMSLEQLMAKVHSLVSFVPFGTEVSSFAIQNTTTLKSVNLSGIRVDSAANWNQKLYQHPYVESFVVGGSLYLPNATAMANFFNGATALLYADLRGLIFTSSMVDVSSLAIGCVSLRTFYFGSGFTGNHIATFSNAFNNCRSLQTIDVENLTTDYATNFSTMFNNCSSIVSLDLSHFNTNMVTIMLSMFSACNRLAKLNLIGWSAAALTTSSQMFYSSPNIETLVWDTTYEDVVANDIKIFDQYNVTTNTYISTATNLNRASLRAWINGLKDLTGQSAKTLTIGATLIAKLSAEDIAVATNKNWTLA